MSISETLVEIGREREYTLSLSRTSPTTGEVESISADSIESVTLNIGNVICLNTDDDSLEFNDGKTAVVAKLGLVEGLETWKTYECWLTVYDALAAATGLPWSRFVIRTVPWSGMCS